MVSSLHTAGSWPSQLHPNSVKALGAHDMHVYQPAFNIHNYGKIPGTQVRSVAQREYYPSFTSNAITPLSDSSWNLYKLALLYTGSRRFTILNIAFGVIVLLCFGSHCG